MTGPSTPRCPLGRLQPQQFADDRELQGMRRAAWLKQGVVMLRPEEILDPWTRQVVVNEANRLYGSRRTDGNNHGR